MPTSRARFLLLIASLSVVGLAAEPLMAQSPQQGVLLANQPLKLPTTWDYINGFGTAGLEAWGHLQNIRGGRQIVPRRSRGVRGHDHGHYVTPERHYTTHDEHYATPHGRYTTPAYEPDPVPPNPAPTPAPRLAPNPLPGHASVPGQIKPIGENFSNFRGGAIVNPASNRVDLNYVLDGKAYTLPPGHYQDLGYTRQWVIQFDRGGSFGAAKYTVGNVKHVFSATQKGWELMRDEPKS